MSEQHLDLDALADVLAGEPAAHLGAHLATCASCRAAVSEFEAALAPVQAALVELPTPELPDAVAVAVEDVIAEERRASATDRAVPSTPPAVPAATTPPAVPAVPAATVTPMAAGRDRRTRWLPIASGVAAAAALVVGAIVVLPGGGGSSDQDSTLSDTAGIRSSSTGTDYGKDGAALSRALPSLLIGSAPKGVAGASQPGAPSVTDGRAESTDALAALREPASLASCLASLSDVDDPGIPLALDYASFEGQPALVVVLPTTRTDKVDVFVVGAGCSQADAKVLFFTRLTRPS